MAVDMDQMTIYPTLLKRFAVFLITGLFPFLFGCGDGKPGIFSSNGYHIGKKMVWYKTSSGLAWTVHELEGVDVSSFAVHTLNSAFGGGSAEYGMDSRSVYFGAHKIAGADVASFEFIFGGYTRDRQAVYYMDRLLTHDVEHIAVVANKFLKDSRYVYFGGDPISDDPAHFEALGPAGSDYFKDKRRCWYDISLIKDADPNTFKVLTPGFAADKHHIYVEMNAITEADAASFTPLEHGYSKDKNHVYSKNIVLEGADPASFRLLNENYCLDKKRCFYYLNPLPGADPSTFRLIDGSYAKDAGQVYINGKLIAGADPASFRVLNSSAGCSCDAKQAYVMDQPIKGVNAAAIPKGATCKSCSERGIDY